jgi:integrase
LQNGNEQTQEKETSKEEKPWFSVEEILDAYYKRFTVLGHKRQLWLTDKHLINRLNNFAHPQFATTEDLEKAVMLSPAQSTRKGNINRYKMIYRHLMYLKLIPERESPAEKLPKLRKPKSMPRPFTYNEVANIMDNATRPQRDWFILSCFAGFRAAEISLCSGSDLEEQQDGYMIRIPKGKGGTDLALPAHSVVVDMIKSYNTFGRLWPTAKSHTISVAAGKELKRLGINKKLHSGRHFFATNAYSVSNGDILAVSKLMRHASPATTAIYAELASPVAKAVVNALQIPGINNER